MKEINFKNEKNKNLTKHSLTVYQIYKFKIKEILKHEEKTVVWSGFGMTKRKEKHSKNERENENII